MRRRFGGVDVVKLHGAGPGAEVVEDFNESLVGRVQNSHAGVNMPAIHIVSLQS